MHFIELLLMDTFDGLKFVGFQSGHKAISTNISQPSSSGIVRNWKQ
jgi:hypothetical protein